MAVVPSSSVIAKSVFSSGANDSYAAVDVYKQTTISGSVNSIQDSESTVGADLKTLAIRGSKYLKQLMPTALTVLRGGQLLMNAASSKDRLMTAAGLASVGFKQLPADFQSYLTDNPKQFGSVLATVNNVSRTVLGTDLTKIRNIQRVAGDLTGNRDLVGVQDNDSTVALFSSIASEASRTRIPGTFTQLATTLQSSQLVSRMAGSTLPAVLSSSDISGLKDMATMVSPGTLNLFNPNVVGDFASNYNSGPLSTAQSKVTDYANIMDAFRATDSNWNVINRFDGDATTTNLSKLSNTTDDFKATIQTGFKTSADPTDHLFAMVDLFPKTSVDNALKTQFPLTYFN